MLQTPPSVPLSVSYIIVGTVIIFFFVVFFYLFFLQLHKRRAVHEREIYQLKTRFEKTILESQIEIQEQTFRNISQEIHDNIGQVLSLAKLNLNTIPKDDTGEKILLTEELLGKAINDLRDISKSMHPEKIADIGLSNAIRNELLMMQRVARISTEIVVTGKEDRLTGEQTIIVFRMIQEILHNIIKHARAKTVWVCIRGEVNRTIIEIKDDGKGFDIGSLSSTETGIGLKSIQQRCALIKAECRIDSQPGAGTSIQLSIYNN